ncbi:MAG: hypothetical protein ACJAR4_002201 [Psychroserpens sp.]|jgi:hypothetical protein
MFEKLFFSFITVLSISGCATKTIGPTPAGENTFVISRQEGAFPSGNEPLLAEALGEANRFCGSLGRAFKLINTHENPGPYILGNYPKATVTFECINQTKSKV